MSGDGLTVRDLCNRFLTAKAAKLATGEIVQRSFDDYHRTCALIIRVFGLTRLVADLAADDFERLRGVIAKGRGPVYLANEVQRCRVLFNFAFKNALIPAPARFGTEFVRPAKELVIVVPKGTGFYGLRHTFETIAGESRDQVAVNAIMGHVDESLAAHSRERIGDERLQAVADHVRKWLSPKPAKGTAAPKGSRKAKAK